MSLIKTDNNYTLPDGNVLINFSGGRTSGMMLHHILEANGGLPDRVKVVFANTGREMPETLDFVQECSERWDVPIVWVEYDNVPDPSRPAGHWFKVVDHKTAARDGEPFIAQIEARRWRLPNAAGRWCTGKLKMNTVRQLLIYTHKWRKWSRALGIRACEPRRIKPSAWKGRPNWFPIFDAGHTVENVNDFWKAQPFDLKLKTNNGTTWLGNCDGCFLKSEASRARLAREYPERFQWWVDVEKRAQAERGPSMTFQRGKTYESLGEYVGRQGDWIFDTEDALCQRDGGECTDI